jgi:hypothetical protein
MGASGAVLSSLGEVRVQDAVLCLSRRWRTGGQVSRERGFWPVAVAWSGRAQWVGAASEEGEALMGTSEAGVLNGELEAVAAAAAERLRAETEENGAQADEAQQAVIAAAGRAMAARVGLGQIAAAEQAGQARVREELGKELLRVIERCARRRREIDREYEQAIRRAGRLGLAQREIAGAAGSAPGTIRALLARPDDAPSTLAPLEEPAAAANA